MKKFFRILCVLLCLFGFATIMTGCLSSEEITSGDFDYIPEGEDKAIICSLSTECFNSGKEIIIIPPYIDGRKVIGIGVVYYYASSSRIYSKTMKEVYVPYTLEYMDSVASNVSVFEGDALEKICVTSNEVVRNSYNLAFMDINIQYYITPISYDFIETSKNFLLNRLQIFIANTSFLFNYEGSPNDDYFFINNFEYGEKINEPPYEPTREGYSFSGWYKEPECINPWNFDSDTLPVEQYDTDGNTLYQETKLYAKWITA